MDDVACCKQPLDYVTAGKVGKLHLMQLFWH